MLDNSSRFAQLLGSLSEEIHIRGREFERIAKWFLENDPIQRQQFRQVWLWMDCPWRWGSDAGVDLCAETHDGERWAIQAKAYASSTTVTKRDLDKFLSDSARPAIAGRLLIATTDRLAPHALRTVAGSEKKVSIILRSQLETASVQWPRSIEALAPARREPKEPRAHQHAAVKAIVEGFAKVPRGRVTMACGTGKTLVGLHAAEQLKAHRTLVLVPSLALLAQTRREWAANWRGSDFAPLAVCSDDSVAADDSTVTRTYELPFDVTSDPDQIAMFMRRASRRVVFSTYQSSPQVAAMYARHRGVPQFDLVIADEAHRCAGTRESAFATILDATAIHATRRLFMTATPRVVTKRLRRELDVEIASMDDERKFGPEFHKLTFAQAIKKDLLCDYQVAVIVIDHQDHRELAERGAIVALPEGESRDARTLAAQLGLAIAMKKYALSRVVTFHSRVAWARAFASGLPAVLALLPKGRRPSGITWAEHVSGEMPSYLREARLQKLRAVAAPERGVLSNARCLTEGIDVPALDGVLFADPRRSTVDVVQAVGRAIRKAAAKKKGTIVLPVFLDRRANPEEAISGTAFEHVWEIIGALRAHDETLASELDSIRREIGRRGSTRRLPAKIQIVASRPLPAGFARSFDICLVENTTSSWEQWFGMLEEFVAATGHARVAHGFKTGAGQKLGNWVLNQRQDQRKGRLTAERAARLAGLAGWSWNVAEEAWDEGLSLVRAFQRKHGHAQVPSESVAAGGFRIGAWVSKQRAMKTWGELSASRVAALDAIPGWTWNRHTTTWDRCLAVLKDYARAHRHARVPQSYRTEDGISLGLWVANQRGKLRAGKLSPDRKSRLEEIAGWTWDTHEQAWEAAFLAVADFSKKKGHANVPATWVTRDGIKLGQWVQVQRTTEQDGSLPAARRRRLDGLPGWTWDPLRDAWESGLRHLLVFVAREGHGVVPAGHIENGFGLGRWVQTQRLNHASDRLGEYERRCLERIRGWSWKARDDEWEARFRRIETFAKREGHARIPAAFVEPDGLRLGAWVVRLRSGAAKLEPERRKRLEGIPGWAWSVRVPNKQRSPRSRR